MKTIRPSCLALLSLTLFAAPLAAAPPSLLGYQGRILVNGTAHDGDGYFKFALTGPTETFWSNDGTGLGAPGAEPLANVPVTVSNGLYSVSLGSAPMVPVPAALFEAQDHISLRVWFSTTPTGPFEQLSPDRRLASVGYALTAATASRVSPGYEIGGGSSLTLETVAPDGTLTFSSTFQEPFGEIPSLMLESGWSSGPVSESGFTTSTTFVTQTVDSAGVVGAQATLAVIAGRPAIGYRDESNSALKFIRAADAEGAQWPLSTAITVDGQLTDSGDYPSLAEVAGHPALCYYHAATGDLRFARADNPEGSSWSPTAIRTVDGVGENVGWHCSLAVVGGVPAISYYAPNSGELRYAWAADAEGTNWPTANRVTVDGVGAPDRGRYSTLLDLGGAPAIAYYDASTADLRFARLTGSNPANPTDWTSLAVDSSGEVGEHCSLAVVAGHPAIAYYDSGNGNLKFARAGDASGSSWPAASVVTADGSSFDRGSYASLAIISGHPAIAYHDASNGDLNFLRASDPLGGSWPAGEVLEVDGSDSQSGSHAAMIALGGLPAIAYHEAAPTYDLRFASLPPARWSARTGDAQPILASGVKDGAITSAMIDSRVGVWERAGNDLYHPSGKVGIGRVPGNNRLEVEGNASKTTAGNWLAHSDQRIKRCVEPVQGALATLDKIRLVSFRYTEEYLARHPTIEDRPYLNVIAQEFARVFPHHVRPSGELLPDGTEILEVDTYPLTIYTAAAAQDLHERLQETEERLANLEQRLRELEAGPQPSATTATTP